MSQSQDQVVPTADELRLQRQLSYYFSDKNLWRDPWLVAQLSERVVNTSSRLPLKKSSAIQISSSEIPVSTTGTGITVASSETCQVLSEVTEENTTSNSNIQSPNQIHESEGNTSNQNLNQIQVDSTVATGQTVTIDPKPVLTDHSTVTNSPNNVLGGSAGNRTIIPVSDSDSSNPNRSKHNHNIHDGRCTGWLDVRVLMTFKRVKQITSDLDIVVKCLERIEEVEVALQNSLSLANTNSKLNNMMNSSDAVNKMVICVRRRKELPPKPNTGKNKSSNSNSKKSQLRSTVGPGMRSSSRCRNGTNSNKTRSQSNISNITEDDLNYDSRSNSTSQLYNMSKYNRDGPNNHNFSDNSDDDDDDLEEDPQHASTTTMDLNLSNKRNLKSSLNNNTITKSDPSQIEVPGFRIVPKTGVIYVMDEAAKHGYSAATAHLWSNLGQGSPETSEPKNWPANVVKKLRTLVDEGKLTTVQNKGGHGHGRSSEGLSRSSKRNQDNHNIKNNSTSQGQSQSSTQPTVTRVNGPEAFTDLYKAGLEVNAENLHYGNVNGDLALRKAVAKFYNEMYRKGKQSLYTSDNVALVGGGRLALTRLVSALSPNINFGHLLPDYTAYTELLTSMARSTINQIPIPLSQDNDFRLSANDLRREIVGKGLSALLLSNPSNPTGQLIEGEELRNFVQIARQTHCSLILDEIYSRYIYTHLSSGTAASDATYKMVSSAQYVEDVNTDPIVILDGLTKNWRMPGLRVCWIVGPASVVEAVSAVGSYLDGGPSLPTQRALVPLLDCKSVIEQTIMLQTLFAHKREFILKRLGSIEGLRVHVPPQGTFYCWLDVSGLPCIGDWAFANNEENNNQGGGPGVTTHVNQSNNSETGCSASGPGTVINHNINHNDHDVPYIPSDSNHSCSIGGINGYNMNIVNMPNTNMTQESSQSESVSLPLNTAWGFFRIMIQEANVICCPGTFFDVNPGKCRKFQQYSDYVRLSYGPSFKEIKRGLDNMERVIEKYRNRARELGLYNNLMGMGPMGTFGYGNYQNQKFQNNFNNLNQMPMAMQSNQIQNFNNQNQSQSNLNNNTASYGSVTNLIALLQQQQQLQGNNINGFGRGRSDSYGSNLGDLGRRGG